MIFKSIFKKIRYKTTFFFLLTGLLPSLFVAFYILTKVRSETIEKIFKIQSERLNSIRTVTAKQLQKYEEQLKFLSNEMNLQSLETEKTSLAVSYFLESTEFFSSIFVFKKDGTMVAPVYKNKFKGDDFMIGKNFFEFKDKESLKTIELLKKVISTRKSIRTQWTEYDRQQTYLMFIVPIYSFDDQNELTGILSGRVSLYGAEMNSLLDYFELKDSEYACITDYEGNIFTYAGDTFLNDLKKIKFTNNESSRKEENVVSGTFKLKGRKDLISFARIKEFNMIIIYGKPVKDVLAFLEDLFRSVIFLFILALLLAAFLGFYFSGNLTEPLMELINGINKVGSGAVSYRINIRREDELGLASEAFNKMAKNLQKNKVLEEIWLRKWEQKKD